MALAGRIAQATACRRYSRQGRRRPGLAREDGMIATNMTASRKQMIRIVYVSFATVPFSDADLAVLLEVSRRNNQRDGLTGMLLYRDGDFLQVLEGEAAAVRKTYDRIAADKRHGRIMVLDESTITQRDFGDWSMGFRRLAQREMPEGFVDFFHRRFDAASVAARGSEALQFLQSFRDISR